LKNRIKEKVKASVIRALLLLNMKIFYKEKYAGDLLNAAFGKSGC